MIDIKAIKAAAEAVRNDVFHVRHDFGKHYVLAGPGEYFMGRVRGKERADFIATANPATVIALCDEIERLRTALKLIEWSNNSAWQAQAATEALKGKPE